jgi:hypothetical protein
MASGSDTLSLARMNPGINEWLSERPQAASISAPHATNETRINFPRIAQCYAVSSKKAPQLFRLPINKLLIADAEKGARTTDSDMAVRPCAPSPSPGPLRKSAGQRAAIGLQHAALGDQSGHEARRCHVETEPLGNRTVA